MDMKGDRNEVGIEFRKSGLKKGGFAILDSQR